MGCGLAVGVGVGGMTRRETERDAVLCWILWFSLLARVAALTPLFRGCCCVFCIAFSCCVFARKKQTKLPLYCTCKQPQNPDRKMILCDACENWFHSTSDAAQNPVCARALAHVHGSAYVLACAVTCVKAGKKEQDAPTWLCPTCKSQGVKVV